MKLYYAPGACSLAIRFLLTEMAVSFEAVRLDLARGDQAAPDFLAVNPKGKVPALALDNGRALTEVGAIAWWIAENHPDRRLVPTDGIARAEAREVVDYCIGTLHMEGIRLVFSPSSAFHRGDSEAVREQGLETLRHGLDLLGVRYPGGGPLFGELSVADFVVTYILFCSSHLQVPLAPGLQAHWEMMARRPSIMTSLAAEGFA